MFATLKSLNLLKAEYQIQFEEIITDNGAEFAGKPNSAHHPFVSIYKLISLYIRP